MIDGETCMDNFVRVERLNQDINKVCSQIGIEKRAKQLPELKSGQKEKKYSTHEHYTQKSREIILDNYSTEIDMFGYEMPSN